MVACWCRFEEGGSIPPLPPMKFILVILLLSITRGQDRIETNEFVLFCGDSIEDSLVNYTDWIQLDFMPTSDSLKVMLDHRVQYYYLFVLDSADTIWSEHLQVALFTQDTLWLDLPFINYKPRTPFDFIIRRK